MNSGLIIVHGSAGDTLGYGMRGGEVYIRDNTGYRAGIHMKEYAEQKPVVVIGGTAGDFMGEYMAGGVMVVLNLNNEKQPIGDYCATGMHGGVIYIRGEVDSHLIKGGSVCQPDVNELKLLDKYITNYKNYFNKEVPPVNVDDFVKIMPGNKRQYGNLYIGI
jgi:glutamate synthase domain-containing protein 3